MPTPLYSEHSLDSLLRIAERKYEVVFEPISAGGVTLEIAQIANMKNLLDSVIAKNGLHNAITTLPLWAKIWPASLILGHYLRHQNLQEHSLLELGAGCGVSGLVAAALGCPQVWITDINEDALLFARINVLKNNLEDKVTVAKTDIVGQRLRQRFSLIIGAEILYLDHLYRPLYKFIQYHLTKPQPGATPPEVLLASDHRRDAEHFFHLAAKSFSIAHQQVGIKETGAQGKEERHLIRLHRLTHKAI